MEAWKLGETPWPAVPQLGGKRAWIGVTGAVSPLSQDWTQNSRDTFVSRPALWVCAPFPEPRELSPRALGHRHRDQLQAMELR